MPSIRLPLFLGTLFVLSGLQAADRPAGAEVRVHAEHRGGEVLYHYEVRNREAGVLRQFWLGCDCAVTGGPGRAQLQVLPAGTVAADEDYRGRVLDVPPEKLSAPFGWRATVLSLPGVSQYWIEWHAFDPSAGIPAGQSMKGFTVAVPGGDTAFLSGDVLVGDGAIERVRTGRVTPVDVTAPKLTVHLQMSQTGDPAGGIAVASTVTARDDFDPEPTVHLESFFREGPGRDEPGPERLALTYRATDASGNTRRETARVTIPDPGARLVGLPGGWILP